jgi:putative protein kinase ArgK-like GTPase of G3E family
LWDTIAARLQASRADGTLAARRARQAGDWLEQTVRELLLAEFLGDAKVAAALAQAKAEVAAGARLPNAAARALLAMRGRA